MQRGGVGASPTQPRCAVWWGAPVSAPFFDLDRWVPSQSAGRFVEHFWSVTWDLRGRERDAAELTGRVQPVDSDLFSVPIDVDDDVGSVAEALDDAIAAHAGGPDPTYGQLTELVGRIRDDDWLHRGRTGHGTLALERPHHRAGVPPLCRLQQAALEIETRPGLDFADLAVRLGWYDQAHFINDFRSMLGSTPGEYAAAHGG